MDMIKNGHSEKNQQKRKKDDFNLKFGEIKEIELNDLSFQEQEIIFMSMAMAGEEQSPKIYCVDAQMHINNYSKMPIKFLIELLKIAINENQFEEAKKIISSIKNRNFSITIGENKLYLKKIK